MKRILLTIAVMALSACAVLNPQQGDRKQAALANTDLGMEYMNQGQHGEAMEKLEKALEQDPQLAPAHAAIALLYTRLDEHEKADNHYRKALFYEPDNATFNNNYGAYLCSRGEVDKAVGYFNKVLSNSTYPVPEKAYTNVGMCLRRKPDLKAAEANFRKAIEKNPQYPQALAQMAIVSYEQQDFMKARAFLQRYEGVTRPTPDMLLLGMRIERQLGNDNASAAYARRLRRIYPGAGGDDEPYVEALD